MSTRRQLLARLLIVPVGVMASLASVWSSVDAPEAVPLHGACVTTAECVREANECMHGLLSTNAPTSHGICTNECTDDTTCGDSARCVQIEPDRRGCAATCTSATDCGDPHLACSAGACVPAL